MNFLLAVLQGKKKLLKEKDLRSEFEIPNSLVITKQIIMNLLLKEVPECKDYFPDTFLDAASWTPDCGRPLVKADRPYIYKIFKHFMPTDKAKAFIQATKTISPREQERQALYNQIQVCDEYREFLSKHPPTAARRPQRAGTVAVTNSFGQNSLIKFAKPRQRSKHTFSFEDL